MRIQIESDGDVQVSRELLRFSGRALDASPAFRSMATLLRGSERKQFATQGGYASGGWERLKPSTVIEKARQGLKRKILQATGEMMRRFTRKTEPGHIEIVGRHQLVFGAESDIAKFHQRGTVNMPQRRPLEIRRQDRTEMVKRLQAYIVKGDS